MDSRERAKVLSQIGRHDAAISHLLESVAEEPDNPELHIALALAWIKREAYDQALRAAEEAIRCRPELSGAHWTRALALVHLRRGREAVTSALKSIRCDPESEASWHVLVEADLAVRSRADSLSHATRLLEIAPDSAAAHELMGRALLLNKRFPDAEASFREALRCDPLDPAAMNNLGLALDSQGRHADALAIVLEATKINPESGAQRANLRVAADNYVNLFSRVPVWVQLIAFVLTILYTRPAGPVLLLGAELVFLYISWKRMDPVVRLFMRTRRTETQRRKLVTLLIFTAVVGLGFAGISAAHSSAVVLVVGLITFILATVVLVTGLRWSSRSGPLGNI